MPAPTTCIISGTVRDPSGTVFSGATIKANLPKPFKHSTDGSLILAYEVSTTSASDGTWSLTLVETATDSTSIIVSITFPNAPAYANARQDYSLTVPNQATAAFASLVGTQ